MSFRIDLHTHSYGSPDGGLSLKDYKYTLKNGKLDYVAITDHGTIEAAKEIKDAIGSLGRRVIIGEEIKTSEGELIGLYLRESIAEGMTLEETVAAIHAQGGLVYVPHPFETVRSGVTPESLGTIENDIDIVETCNGRAVFQNKSQMAKEWCTTHRVVGAVSSDAHGAWGWGKTYTIISGAPTPDNLVQEVAKGRYSEKHVGLGILYPKYHRVRRMIIK